MKRKEPVMKEYERMDQLGISKNDLIGKKIVIDVVGEPFLVKDADGKPTDVQIINIELPDFPEHPYLSFMVSEGNALARPDLEGCEYLTMGTKDVGKQSPMFVWKAYKE